LRGKIALEVVHDAGHSAGEKFEAPTKRSDHEGIEAVVTGKDLPLKMVGLIRLFTEQNGVNFRAVEKHNPVAGKLRMKDGYKVDVVLLRGGFPFGPDSDRIQSAGEFPVALFLMEKIIEVLESGDQFSRGGFMREILDGMADGKHRLMVKEMVDVKNKIEREKNYLNVTNKEIINKLNT
jgi:hypothetical protein